MRKQGGLRRYKVQLFATLPASATLIVEASNAKEAKEYAEEHSLDADWSGADYDRPDGSQIDGVDISNIELLPD